LYNLAESCRVIAVLISPVLPGAAAGIYAQLGLGGLPGNFAEAHWGGLVAGHAIGEPVALFPRRDSNPPAVLPGGQAPGEKVPRTA
jgi:methionyl-tRNA synthetase